MQPPKHRRRPPSNRAAASDVSPCGRRAAEKAASSSRRHPLRHCPGILNPYHHHHHHHHCSSRLPSMGPSPGQLGTGGDTRGPGARPTKDTSPMYPRTPRSLTRLLATSTIPSIDTALYEKVGVSRSGISPRGTPAPLLGRCGPHREKAGVPATIAVKKISAAYSPSLSWTITPPPRRKKRFFFLRRDVAAAGWEPAGAKGGIEWGAGGWMLRGY